MARNIRIRSGRNGRNAMLTPYVSVEALPTKSNAQSARLVLSCVSAIGEVCVTIITARLPLPGFASSGRYGRAGSLRCGTKLRETRDWQQTNNSRRCGKRRSSQGDRRRCRQRIIQDKRLDLVANVGKVGD